MLQNGIDHDIQDMRYLKWSHVRSSSGTAGTFLKASEETGGTKVYYKMSNFDYVNGVVGHECINEIIADRLFYLLGIDHLMYCLLHALVTVDEKDFETYICASADFKKKGESKIALDDLYDLQHEPGEDRMAFCRRMGWEEAIYRMTVADFLIINRDRHGANIEVLKSEDGYRLAPLFDHGLSLLFSCYDGRGVEEFDPLADLPVQSFLSSHSLFENLEAIQSEKRPVFQPLHETDREYILEGLDGLLSPQHLEKIWQVIWQRWNYYEAMQNH